MRHAELDLLFHCKVPIVQYPCKYHANDLRVAGEFLAPGLPLVEHELAAALGVVVGWVVDKGVDALKDVELAVSELGAQVKDVVQGTEVEAHVSGHLV